MLTFLICTIPGSVVIAQDFEYLHPDTLIYSER